MIGKNINGYQIEEYRGKGSFGTVYRCTKNHASYAMKIFSLEYVYEEIKRDISKNRITQEIEVLRRMNHENVVKFYDFGSFIDLNITYFYITMEFLEGENLKEVIARDKPLSAEEWTDISIQILQGLETIHNNNVVHRDLKPENIFLTKNGKIKIVDFGLSKIIDFSSITSTGNIIGSPLYMSPEQIRDSKNIDYRSDYYCFGVILFELISKRTPYGDVTSREELFYKIINEKPLSVSQFIPTISNNLDNLVNSLLEKETFRRPNSISVIISSLKQSDDYKEIIANFDPTFFLRLYNDKTVVSNYTKDKNELDFCIFPINHQDRQKGLLKFIQDANIPFIIDPATMRLAYDSFADVKGLVNLTYSPSNYSKLEIESFSDLAKKQEYVKLVIEEQLKHNPSAIVAPFHISNNSNLVTIKNDTKENWFTLDAKLLKETKQYLVNNNIEKSLVGGFCVRSDILTSQTEQEYFINVLSGLPCDYYLIYVDCIDFTSNSAQLYHYIKTLYLLQKYSGKPVIAGRVNTIGLILLAFGIYGFEAGAARFERFSEDLYSETSDQYNMFVMYYIPELLRNIAVQRKDPSKIFNILENKYGENLRCSCPYCINKTPDELVVDELTKKHFLYRRMEEIKILRNLEVPERIDFIVNRISNAIEYYKSLRPVFKQEDYTFLSNWLKVITDLRGELGL